MSVRSGQSVTVEFTTRKFDTGVATNADSTPGGTLYVNGTANGASVTVTSQATGIYKAAVTLPTLAVSDVVSIMIAATVNGVSDNAVIWSDTKDVFAGAIPDVAAGAAGGLFIAGSNAATTVNITGTVSGNSTPTDVTNAVSSIETFGQIHWVTATGFAVPGDTMKNDMTQAVPTTNTNQTVGDALNAARAQGFGPWSIVGNLLKLFAADGTTVVHQFTLDSTTAPTSRT